MYDWDMGDSALNTWVRLRQTWEAMISSVESELETYNITLPQLDILLMLAASETSLTPSEIASLTFRELHTVSGLLSRMERVGYVCKIRNTNDRRFVRVMIQPKGQQLLDTVMASRYTGGRRIVKNNLSDDEIGQLDCLLKKLRDGALADLSIKSKPLPRTLRAPAMVRRTTKNTP